jgi:hypothetical protein
MEKLGQAAVPPAAVATPRRQVNHSFAAPAVLPRRLTASGCVEQNPPRTLPDAVDRAETGGI